MPSGKYHRKRSKELFGNEYAEVHQWMDEPCKKYGKTHRTFRHDKYALEYIENRWGQVGREAAIQHIVDDLNNGMDRPVSSEIEDKTHFIKSSKGLEKIDIVLSLGIFFLLLYLLSYYLFFNNLDMIYRILIAGSFYISIISFVIYLGLKLKTCLHNFLDKNSQLQKML